MRTRFCLVVLVAILGCGSPATAPIASAAPPPTSEAPPAPAPSVAGPVPDDFVMEIGGGPVQQQVPRPGEMRMVTRLEPRPGATGEFDLVQRSVPGPGTEEMPPLEMQRVPVPAERVVALYGLLASGRSVLERPCIDLQVQDGTTHFIRVEQHGASALYQCTNTSTPEFDALQAAFERLVSDLVPSAAES